MKQDTTRTESGAAIVYGFEIAVSEKATTTDNPGPSLRFELKARVRRKRGPTIKEAIKEAVRGICEAVVENWKAGAR